MNGTWEADWDGIDHVRFLQGVSRVDKPFPDSWKINTSAYKTNKQTIMSQK